MHLWEDRQEQGWDGATKAVLTMCIKRKRLSHALFMITLLLSTSSRATSCHVGVATEEAPEGEHVRTPTLGGQNPVVLWCWQAYRSLFRAAECNNPKQKRTRTKRATHGRKRTAALAPIRVCVAKQVRQTPRAQDVVGVVCVCCFVHSYSRKGAPPRMLTCGRCGACKMGRRRTNTPLKSQCGCARQGVSVILLEGAASLAPQCAERRAPLVDATSHKGILNLDGKRAM